MAGQNKIFMRPIWNISVWSINIYIVVYYYIENESKNIKYSFISYIYYIGSISLSSPVVRPINLLPKLYFLFHRLYRVHRGNNDLVHNFGYDYIIGVLEYILNSATYYWDPWFQAGTAWIRRFTSSRT